jgi:serine phosphatase RsbU (regulator of sigma subunit)
MQRAMVPTTAPRIEGFEVAGGTTLEDEGRGNTTWDHVALPDGRTAVVVLDVRSDGLPAAHVAGLARAAIRTAAQSESDPPRLLRAVNQALAGMNLDGADQFVECGVLVAGDGAVEWASAGRVPAGVLGRDGTLHQLGSHGPPLGMMEGFGYGAERIETGPGDAVLLLSSASMGLFRGAADLVAQVHGKPAGEVVKTVHRAIRKAQEGDDSTEEISAVYLRRY